jgi:signal transduction histidine kinase
MSSLARSQPAATREAARLAACAPAMDRLSTVAQMAASVSHAMSNVVMVAAGNLRLLAEDVDGGAEAQDILRDLAATLADGERIAAGLGMVGNLERYTPRVVELGPLLQEWIGQTAPRLQPAMRLQVSCGSEAVLVSADPEYLRGALNALLQNAAHAGGDSGAVDIACHAEPLDMRAAGQPFVEITFADRGPGLSQRASTRAFELGYTTRPTGCGLGLWLVREFARAAGGDAFIASVPERGALVTLLLPRLRPDEAPPTIITERDGP